MMEKWLMYTIYNTFSVNSSLSYISFVLEVGELECRISKSYLFYHQAYPYYHGKKTARREEEMIIH